MPKRQRIGEYLVEKGLITEARLREALEDQRRTGKRLGLILVERGFLSEEQVTKALSSQLRIDYIDLANYTFTPKITKLISQQQAQRLLAIPLKKTANKLEVAMENPLDMAAINELHTITALDIKPVFAYPSVLKKSIAKIYKSEEALVVKKEMFAEGGKAKLDNILAETTKESVISTVNRIVENAVKANASDIHLEPEEKNFVIRFRIDGILHKIEELSKEQELTVISRLKIMADMDIAEKRLPQDGRIELKALNKDIDLRVSTFPTLHGENISIRVLDKSTGFIKLDNLGFGPKILDSFSKIIKKPKGIVLVTGPTGSGKTTTLYAALNLIRSDDNNILTLEDPIEYVIPKVRQSQINIKAGLTFASGLRAMVRQDPDVVMIGEIRDRETAEIAIHSALTGHLVLSTLHTNDAAGAATRLIDMGVEPFLIASTLTGVLAQRLVRRLCSKCKKAYNLTDGELKSIKSSSVCDVSFVLKRVYKAVGCKECRNTGYKGRIGLFELLIPDEDMRRLIIAKSGSQEISKLAYKKGMRMLFEDGLEKVSSGITSLSELLRVAEEE